MIPYQANFHCRQNLFMTDKNHQTTCYGRKNINLCTCFWQIKMIPDQGPGAQAEGGGAQVSQQQLAKSNGFAF